MTSARSRLGTAGTKLDVESAVTDQVQHDPEQLLRLLAEQAEEHALLLLDRDGVITWWGGGAALIFGMERSAALGRPFAVLFTKEDAAAGMPDYEMAVARANGTAENDRWMGRPDGSRFWAAGVLTALRDQRGELLGFGKIIRNRTDLREQLDTVRNQLRAASDANYQKDVFLSTLSHELRNPLAPLSNAVQLIRITSPRQADLEPLLKIIDRQIDNLRRLVDDLLDISRVGVGKIELKLERVSLHEVVERAVESTRPLVRERRHVLDVIMPAAAIMFEADSTRLEQVFTNLIQNAAKYTPEGGHIWVKGTTEGPEAVVHVQDNGMGIPHDMLPRIFDLFTQVETSRPQAQGGLGIGLSLVKTMVTLHGGSVQVHSDGEGKGSEFTVRLPLTPH
jgi:PAS domain S-box-containing protein